MESCVGWDTSNRVDRRCGCVGYIAAPGPLCVCGHMPGMHFRDGPACRFAKQCDCAVYRAVPLVPLEQLRHLAQDTEVIVVVVPIELRDIDDLGVRTAELIAGDLTNQAHILLVQQGPALYYVNKHPERDKVGGIYSTEETTRQNLLRMRRNLTKG